MTAPSGWQQPEQMTGEIAWVGLGSNLENPAQQLQQAVHALGRLPGTKVLQVSPIYRSAALLPGRDAAPPVQPQADFLNAVAKLETQLCPRMLLGALHGVEAAQGRQRRLHWGDRTLDLDLLMYADRQSQDPTLLLPHPGIASRRFVLQPLLDLDPALVVPGLGCADSLLKCCSSGPIVEVPSKLTRSPTRNSAAG